MLIDQKDFKKDIKGEPFHSLDTPPPPPRPPSPYPSCFVLAGGFSRLWWSLGKP